MTKSEYDKRFREIAKAEHRCIQCGKQDAYTLNGRSRCSVCADKGKIADRKRYQTHNSAEAQKNVRKKRVEKGLCVRCGRVAPPGRRTCALCISHTNQNLRDRKIAEGMNWPIALLTELIREIIGDASRDAKRLLICVRTL